MPNIDNSLKKLLEEAWEVRCKNFPNILYTYLPGMIRYGNMRGRYPAISITGNKCILKCLHCNGRLLAPMIHVKTPEELLRMAKKMASNGTIGILITGGSDKNGHLPWSKYLSVIEKIKRDTNMHISVHTGILDRKTAFLLADAGIDQALIDVIGSNETASTICHLKGIEPIINTLYFLKEAKIDIIPHIVVGLHFGEIKDEETAIMILKDFHLDALVFVVFTPLKGTPMENMSPPDAFQIAKLIAIARIAMPQTSISLGCERLRGPEGRLLEKLSLQAGINRITLLDDEILKKAKVMGLKTLFQPTCCSVHPLYKKTFS